MLPRHFHSAMIPIENQMHRRCQCYCVSALRQILRLYSSHELGLCCTNLHLGFADTHNLVGVILLGVCSCNLNVSTGVQRVEA